MKIKPVKQTPKGWFFNFRLPVSGERFRQVISASSKTAACEEAKRIYLEDLAIRDAMGGKARAKPTPIITAAKLYLETESQVRKAPSSILIDRLSLDELLSVVGPQRPLNLISPLDMEQLVSIWSKKGWMVQTINRRMNSAKAFLNWAAEKGWCHQGLAKSLKHLKSKGREARPMPDECFKRLLAASPETLRAQMFIARATGLRAGEVASLEWACIRRDSLTLQVGGTTEVTTKSRRSRVVPFPGELLQIFESLRRKQFVGCKWVFPSRSGKGPMSSQRVSRAFARARKRAGIEDVIFHDLRATFATRVAELGAGDAVTAGLLGHSSVEMARRYSRNVHNSIGKQLVEKTGMVSQSRLGRIWAESRKMPMS